MSRPKPIAKARMSDLSRILLILLVRMKRIAEMSLA